MERTKEVFNHSQVVKMVTELKESGVFEAAISSGDVSVVHFQAPWAEQCAQVNEVLGALSTQNEFSKIKFYSCEAEELSDISAKYRIEAVPTVIVFKSNTPLEIVHGADAPKIIETIKKYSSGQSNTTSAKLSLEDRLKSLINKSNVMLFMKGDRVSPKCGFSKQIIEILNSTGASYETFNILEDEEVRQGLKTYSDWPTYPQLYVKGELIGGLDIVKEMMAAGELQAMLTSQ